MSNYCPYCQSATRPEWIYCKGCHWTIPEHKEQTKETNSAYGGPRAEMGRAFLPVLERVLGALCIVPTTPTRIPR